MGWIDDLAKAWEREYPGLDTGVFPPMVRLARLAVLIEAFQQQVLGPFGLSPSDYGVLAALRRGGPPYQLKPSGLYGRLQRSSGGMTKILKRLEERGLVERAPDPLDGRGSVVSLTDAGNELQEQIFHAYLEATQDLLDPLSETELKDADRTLAMLLDLLERSMAR